MHNIFTPVFPQRLDSTCRGHPLALWLFVPVAVVLLLTGHLASRWILLVRPIAPLAPRLPRGS